MVFQESTGLSFVMAMRFVDFSLSSATMASMMAARYCSAAVGSVAGAVSPAQPIRNAVATTHTVIDNFMA
jgi:putative Ca2+/H+ antiporter (TMEM165/GDT1 family)